MASSAVLNTLDIAWVKIGTAHYITLALSASLSVEAIKVHARNAQASLEAAHQRITEDDLDRAMNTLAGASNELGKIITSYKVASCDRRMALSAKSSADVALGILQAMAT